jgi:hypothetical protein
MIDEFIFGNLVKKFNRCLAKNDKEGAQDAYSRLSKMYQEHKNDSMGTSLYFTLKGMKVFLDRV